MRFLTLLGATTLVAMSLIEIRTVKAESKEDTVSKEEYAACISGRKNWFQLTDVEKQLAWENVKNWKPGDPTGAKPCRLPGKKSVARTGDGSQSGEPWVTDNVCPAGTRQYQKTALFGLIKGQKLCLSDYEAESLRAQQQRDIQNNIRNNQPRFINCTSNIYGNYVSTSCY